MKHIIIIIASLFLLACSGDKTNSRNHDASIRCHIEGTVHNRPQSDKLLLYVGIDGNVALSSKPYDEIEVSNGQFSYDFYIDEPQYCELVFEDELKNGAWHSIDFVADNSSIKMNLYPTAEYNKTDIEGVGATAEYQSYKLQLQELQNHTNEVREKLKAEGRYNSKEYSLLIDKISAIKTDTPERKRLIEELQAMTEEQQYTPEALAERKRYQAECNAALLEIINGEPSIARLTILARQMVYNLPPQEYIDALNNIYATKMANNATTKFCLRQITGLSLQIGSHYIDFEAPDLDGQIHKLSEMVDGAKLVMLDLWASWCGPCRKASMEMIPLYEQYHDKGFTIIGVARETESTKSMEKVIKKDGYKWPQLVELDDRANIWAKYGCINAAGRRILFDANGKILAFDPTIKQLAAYIDKYIIDSK